MGKNACVTIKKALVEIKVSAKPILNPYTFNSYLIVEYSVISLSQKIERYNTVFQIEKVCKMKRGKMHA